MAEFVEERIKPFKPDPDGNEDQAQRAEQVAEFDQQQAQHPGEQHFQRHHGRQRQLGHAENPAVARLVVGIGFRPGARGLVPGSPSLAIRAILAILAGCANLAERAILTDRANRFAFFSQGLRGVGHLYSSRCFNLCLGFAPVFGALRCSISVFGAFGCAGI